MGTEETPAAATIPAREPPAPRGAAIVAAVVALGVGVLMGNDNGLATAAAPPPGVRERETERERDRDRERRKWFFSSLRENRDE